LVQERLMQAQVQLVPVVHRRDPRAGAATTDRFAVDKKGKPKDQPSGHHPFDRSCAQHGITHRLARPCRPQTKGMVERFNRRRGEHLNRMPQKPRRPPPPLH
jgi:hypothetical protein